MDKVPAYLVAHFIKVRNHMDGDDAVDEGWLRSRFTSRSPQRAMELALVLEELADLHLVGFATEKEELVYIGGDFCPDPPDQWRSIIGAESVMRPREVVLFPRGRWLWTEFLFEGLAWAAAAAVGAVIGTLATGALAGAAVG